MIHDLAKLSGDEWTRISGTSNSIIHFFNESERAAISTEQAADIWLTQIVPLRSKGNKLVSPSCASDEKGRNWMRRAESERPDFWGVHWYGTDYKEAIGYLRDMNGKFPGQRIIVSEIASVSRHRNEVVRFTAEVAN